MFLNSLCSWMNETLRYGRIGCFQPTACFLFTFVKPTISCFLKWKKYVNVNFVVFKMSFDEPVTNLNIMMLEIKSITLWYKLNFQSYHFQKVIWGQSGGCFLTKFMNKQIFLFIVYICLFMFCNRPFSKTSNSPGEGLNEAKRAFSRR